MRMLGSLHPAGLAQLVVANIFGSHRDDYWGPNGNTEPLVALTDDSFNYLFVGAVPVILLLWFGIAGGGAFRRGRMLLAATAALALIYALGRYTPAVRVGVRLGAGREPLPPPGRRQLRLRRDACAALRRAARRLHPRGRAAPAPAGERRGGARGARGGRRPASSSPAAPAIPAMRSWPCSTTVPIAAAVILMLALARGARMRSVAAVAVTVIAVARAGLVERRVPAQCRAAPRLCRAGAAVRRRRRGARSGRARRRASAATMASARASRSWGSAAPGRTSRWCARSKRSTATIRCASASTTGWWRPAKRNWRMELRDFPASFDGYDCALARTLGLEFVRARPPDRGGAASRAPAGRRRAARRSRRLGVPAEGSGAAPELHPPRAGGRCRRGERPGLARRRARRPTAC